ncbi:ClpX C4-type zinc finger protein [Actinomadura sp. DC4]|uniref:ClpX C4-type zinc finger protein n=1 Tax=Actinomadura sp. DC4 TaxID=3055069 RepID=UPI0025B1D080|nr:ClpX C4-type zinc finger protein [Actinomadura sp. DC4]MDN3355645.1 ClpX C4-type zinc finger protein [Actinomadura sp. DC4]
MSAVTEESVIAECSFCLRPDNEVGTLVAGPGVFICDECVGLCTFVIEGKPPEGGSRLAPWDQVTSPEEVLANLPRVAAAGAQVERNLAGWVLKARAMGVTWARIGETLGMSRQSAWERFSGEE